MDLDVQNQLWVGTRKGLFRISDFRQGTPRIEHVEFSGIPVSMAIQDPREGTVYAALDHGHYGVKLHRSTNAGATFDELPAPAYPTKPEGTSDVDPNQQREREWKLSYIWALTAAPSDIPRSLWCGTIPGGLFRTRDRGESWQLNEALWNEPKREQWFGGGMDDPGLHSIIVHPTDPDQVWVGVSCGGVWYTADGGQSWEVRATGMKAGYMPPDLREAPWIQDVHCLAQCLLEPDTLWAQHHSGIFRTTDGGRTWTEIEEAGPSTFGFAVVAHPRDPNTAWFVPATADDERLAKEGRVVVTRTRDGGKTFDVLTEGLPQQNAYDLVYRHALDLDRAGETLAFGSTTGNLYLSADGGDTWQTLSNHLPPIYSVRFGI